MWVAVWARAMARRRRVSICANALSPTATAPSTTVPLWTNSPRIGACTSLTSMTAPPSARMVPWSANCPPISA